MIPKRDFYGLMIWKRVGDSDWHWGICLTCEGGKKWFEGHGPKQEFSVYDGEALLKVTWDDAFNLTSHDCELTFVQDGCPNPPGFEGTTIHEITHWRDGRCIGPKDNLIVGSIPRGERRYGMVFDDFSHWVDAGPVLVFSSDGAHHVVNNQPFVSRKDDSDDYE